MGAEEWADCLKKALPAELTKLREARGLSKNELSVRTGLARSFITYLEQGRPRHPSKPWGVIRPTAVGKKNWLFMGSEDTGDRSAVIYTLIESVKRHGHEPYSYLKDVLERLPGMKVSELDDLLPANWQLAAAIELYEEIWETSRCADSGQKLSKVDLRFYAESQAFVPMASHYRDL